MKDWIQLALALGGIAVLGGLMTTGSQPAFQSAACDGQSQGGVVHLTICGPQPAAQAVAAVEPKLDRLELARAVVGSAR